MANAEKILPSQVNFNSPPDNSRLAELEAQRGPQPRAPVHVSVPVRRVLARTLSLYRARIGNDD
jgi:hypothetical protein